VEGSFGEWAFSWRAERKGFSCFPDYTNMLAAAMHSLGVMCYFTSLELPFHA
jgi:hypothetical protein